MDSSNSITKQSGDVSKLSIAVTAQYKIDIDISSEVVNWVNDKLISLLDSQIDAAKFISVTKEDIADFLLGNDNNLRYLEKYLDTYLYLAVRSVMLLRARMVYSDPSLYDTLTMHYESMTVTKE